MKIKQIVNAPDGSYLFEAELSDEQHSFLIEYALKDMMRRGLIPKLREDMEELVNQQNVVPTALNG